MKVLLIGDVVGQVGCDYVRRVLPILKKDLHVDLVIANGENSAVGNGILPQSATHLFDSGVDVITGGNHTFKRREILQYLEDTPSLLRPANLPRCHYGAGYSIFTAFGYPICIINLQGRVYMDAIDCPFQVLDSILNETRCKVVIVDFHAEATGEKLALAHYCDGRVSCFVGTHTHVQTADETILPHGTGYISDLGMTGPIDSILGIRPENIIQKLTTGIPNRFEVPNGPCKLEGLLADLDGKTGKCLSIERIRYTARG